MCTCTRACTCISMCMCMCTFTCMCMCTLVCASASSIATMSTFPEFGKVSLRLCCKPNTNMCCKVNPCKPHHHTVGKLWRDRTDGGIILCMLVPRINSPSSIPVQSQCRNEISHCRSLCPPRGTIMVVNSPSLISVLSLCRNEISDCRSLCPPRGTIMVVWEPCAFALSVETPSV